MCGPDYFLCSLLCTVHNLDLRLVGPCLKYDLNFPNTSLSVLFHQWLKYYLPEAHVSMIKTALGQSSGYPDTCPLIGITLTAGWLRTQPSLWCRSKNRNTKQGQSAFIDLVGWSLVPGGPALVLYLPILP